MQAMGATQADIDAHLGHLLPDDECPVHPKNWLALTWFLSIDDLFRYEQSVCLGLDILAVRADAALRKLRIKPKVYETLRELGRLATVALNENIQTRREQ